MEIQLKELLDQIKKDGVDAVLEKVCSLKPDGELATLVKEKIEFIKKEGWLNE